MLIRNDPPRKLKENLEQSKRLKNILQIALAPFYKEIAQNNRQHYTAVLNRSIELFAIDDNWDRISSELESNSDEMDDLYTEKTDEESEYQSKALNYVQVILGISVLFDIFRNILPSDSPLLTPILQIISWAALIVLVFIIVILSKSKVSKSIMARSEEIKEKRKAKERKKTEKESERTS